MINQKVRMYSWQATQNSVEGKGFDLLLVKKKISFVKELFKLKQTHADTIFEEVSCLAKRLIK